MPRTGDEISNDSGFRLRFLKTAADTSGELLEMEATYTGGALPPPHFHPRQEEHFTVLEGSINTVIDGTERRYGAGESFEVPAGVAHQMASDGHALLRWEVRPALRTAEFFEQIYPARAAGGAKGFLRTMAVLADFRDEFRPSRPGEPLQSVLVRALAPLGRRVG